MKETRIVVRCAVTEREIVQKIADAEMAGDFSTAVRQLIREAGQRRGFWPVVRQGAEQTADRASG